MTESNSSKITAEKNPEVIDLFQVWKRIWCRKKLFFKVWGITFVLACLWILPVPRSYDAELTLAPELGGENSVGGLASLASSFGFNMGNLESSDAFYPELYPEVISTNQFIVDLLDIQVKSIDGTINTNYYDYLKNYQKKTFYMKPISWVKRQVKAFVSPKEERPVKGDGNGRLNPFMLTEDDNAMIESVRNKISCSVDKKTYVITIAVEDQDPLICACLADSIRVRLQNFITDYRTSKARVDMNHYAQIVDSTKHDYLKALNAYAHYADTHKNSVLQLYLSERDKLENEVTMKLSTYTAMNTQYEAAKAKLQEKTPVFTVLKAATVPVKATHPKRMLFVIVMLFLATIVTIGYVFKEEVIEQLSNMK